MRPAWIIRVSGLLVLLQQPVLPSNNRRADFPRPPRLLLILTGVDTCCICMERQKREQHANDAPASHQWHLNVYPVLAKATSENSKQNKLIICSLKCDTPLVFRRAAIGIQNRTI